MRVFLARLELVYDFSTAFFTLLAFFFFLPEKFGRAEFAFFAVKLFLFFQSVGISLFALDV
jgi:hypothetical protein